MLCEPLLKIFSTTNNDDRRSECEVLTKTKVWCKHEEKKPFSVEEVHRASFIIQRRRSDMREGDASVCITPELPLRCITLMGGSFLRV